MNKKQYNNIIFGTVKAEKALKDEPLKMVRKICNNMGVALPQGDCKQILKTLKAGGFMAWRRCSAREAQAAANSGIAAIAISENNIAMLSADTAEATVAATDEATATSAVMTLGTATNAGMEYYSYGTGVVTTDELIPENYINSETWWPTYNFDYRGRQILTNEQIEKIRKLMPFYQKTGREKSMSWKILAAIHYREMNLLKGATNKYGPYQQGTKTYPVKDEYTDEEFQSATNDAADHILTKISAAGFTAEDIRLYDNIKEVLFRYNGVALAYKNQAIKLGFSEDEAKNGEGSPYVMNKADLIRDCSVEPTKSNNTWGQIKVDGGSIEYPANTYHYGAFIVYKAL